MAHTSAKNSSGISISKLVLSTLLIVGAVWVVLNRQLVIDQIQLMGYAPTAEVTALADNTQLQQHGRNLFYASDPKVQNGADFNASCSLHEQTIVLGCYKSQRIYLYNIQDQRFNGIKEVTAAHEMLHAAYERLSESERRDVDRMLKPVVDGMTDPRILELIDLYEKTEPGEKYNEMHSILGTEYATLTPELEAYYQKYFKDRSVVVRYAGQYQAVFTDSRNKIEEYDRQLGVLKPQIDRQNETLQRLQVELQSESDQLSAYRASGQIQQYNQRVPGYNARVSEFNALVELTRSQVAQHNSIVEARNQQVAAQANLYESIDSNKYQSVEQGIE